MQDASNLEKQELAAKIAQQGAIGQALEQALKDLGTCDEEDLLSCSKDKSYENTVTKMATASGEQQSVNNAARNNNYAEILQHYVPQQFGRLVSNTNWNSTCDHGRLVAHLSYYNRFHGQWRIVANKAILRPKRLPIYRKMSQKKKVPQRMVQEEIDALPQVEIDGDLQILAYHDLS